MKEEMFDDSYYDEDFNDDWDSDKEEDDEFSFDPDDINDKIDWMENIEDPDLLEDFNLDDMDDLDDVDDGDDQFNFDE
jgi:hypothetical protein